MFVDCGICGREMTDADCGPDGIEASCLKCRAKARRREAAIRALVARAHAEGRMPPALRYIRRSEVDLAMADY